MEKMKKGRPDDGGLPGAKVAERKGRILLADDEEINREIAEKVLSEAGFSVVAVPDGLCALEAVRDSPPGYFDLLLTDIRMPVMNGFDSVRAIRALGRADAAVMPILALSSDSTPDDVRTCIACGMNGHIAKPFDPDGLLAEVAETVFSVRHAASCGENGRFRPPTD